MKSVKQILESLDNLITLGLLSNLFGSKPTFQQLEKIPVKIREDLKDLKSDDIKDIRIK